MKFIKFIFIIAVLLLSCSSPNEPNLHIISSGIIKKIEISAWQYGTHTLNDKDGKPLFALKSSTKDLNAYNDVKVSVLGISIEGYPVDGGPEYLDVIAIKKIDY